MINITEKQCFKLVGVLTLIVGMIAFYTSPIKFIHQMHLKTLENHGVNINQRKSRKQAQTA